MFSLYLPSGEISPPRILPFPGEGNSFPSRFLPFGIFPLPGFLPSQGKEIPSPPNSYLFGNSPSPDPSLPQGRKFLPLQILTFWCISPHRILPFPGEGNSFPSEFLPFGKFPLRAFFPSPGKEIPSPPNSYLLENSPSPNSSLPRGRKFLPLQILTF